MTSGVKRPSYRRIFSMAIPIILQSSISGCATLVDNLMVGSLGSGVISGVATTCNPTKIVTETFGDIYDVVFENITVCKHSAVTTDGPGEPIREMVNPPFSRKSRNDERGEGGDNSGLGKECQTMNNFSEVSCCGFLSNILTNEKRWDIIKIRTYVLIQEREDVY